MCDDLGVCRVEHSVLDEPERIFLLGRIGLYRWQLRWDIGDDEFNRLMHNLRERMAFAYHYDLSMSLKALSLDISEEAHEELEGILTGMMTLRE